MTGPLGYGLVTAGPAGSGSQHAAGSRRRRIPHGDGRSRCGTRWAEEAALKDRGLNVEFHHCDITDEAAVEKLIQSLPPLRALVNCAEMTKEAPVFDLTVADFRRHYEVNLIATFILLQGGGAADGAGGEDRQHRLTGGFGREVLRPVGSGVERSRRQFYPRAGSGIAGKGHCGERRRPRLFIEHADEQGSVRRSG